MNFFYNENIIEDSFNKESTLKLISIKQLFSKQTKMLRALHAHEDRLEILLVRQGNGIHQIGSQRYQIAKGDLLVYNANTTHDEFTDSNVGKIVFFCAISGLKLKGLDENCLVPSGRCPVVQSGRHYDELEHLFSILNNHANPQTKDEAEYLQYLLRALIMAVNDIITNQAIDLIEDNEEFSTSIKEYIDMHYLEDITLASIEEALNLSKYYLSHIFKDSFGISPIQYVIRRRIGEAQSYLMYSDMKVNEIAYNVGFKNINHFHNLFLKLVGVSPGKYRKYWPK